MIIPGVVAASIQIAGAFTLSTQYSLSGLTLSSTAFGNLGDNLAAIRNDTSPFPAQKITVSSGASQSFMSSSPLNGRGFINAGSGRWSMYEYAGSGSLHLYVGTTNTSSNTAFGLCDTACLSTNGIYAFKLLNNVLSRATLSTAYSLTTIGSFTSSWDLTTLVGGDSITAMAFSLDGKKLFLHTTSASASYIKEFSFNTAWDLTGIVFVKQILISASAIYGAFSLYVKIDDSVVATMNRSNSYVWVYNRT